MASIAMAPEERHFSVGRVFSRAFSIMGKHAPLVFGVAFVVGALPQSALKFVTAGLQPDLQQRGVYVGLLALGLIGVALWSVMQALVQGVTVHAALLDREGRRATVGESVGYALSRALPLIAVSFLFTLAMGIGMVLFLIPFFFIATRWAVAPAAVVAERNGIFGAFRRSAELTAGARWKVLGVGILVMLLLWLLAAVFGVIGVSLVGIRGLVEQSVFNPITLVANLMVNTLTSAVWSASQAALYIELRDWKDGPTTDRLADIFA